MKNLLILLLLISSTVYSQQSKTIQDKQGQTRQLKNLNNDKYMDKYNYNNSNDTIICESVRGQRAFCYVDTRYGVNIIQQLSRASCNYNWGYDDQGIWVDNGCRAEFSINSGWDQPGAEGNIMVCESHRYQRNYCRAYLDGRDVFLLNQLSDSSCIKNWGYDRNGVWVTNGCRAEFVIEDRYSSQNDIVVCSSRNLQFQGCQADTRGGVEFLRQISRASCNGNWGYDRYGIWVTNGCRAKFRIMPYHGYGNSGHNIKDTVKCSSKNRQRRTCRADTSGGVRLKKQHSNASCRGNWGYTRNQIWVDNGCRATFQLFIDGNRNNHGYGNNRNQDFGNNHGYGNGSNHQPNQAVKLTCSSRGLKRKSCDIPPGSQVEFLRQISRSSCDRNWGYNRHEIWVDNGCRAEFNVRQ